MQKLFIPNLEVSITDRCNLNCEHCMRGEKSNTNISDILLEKIFSEVGYVSNLTVTGGEPLMVKDRLKYLVYVLRKYKVSVEQFGFTTNGTLYDENFEKIFDDFENYLEKTPMTYGNIHDDKRVYIDFSDDEYHQKDIMKSGNYNYQKNIANLKKSAYFCGVKYLRKGIYNLGNAKNIVVPHSRKIENPKLYKFQDQEYYYIGPYISISTNGFILKHNVENNFSCEDTYGHVLDGIYKSLDCYAKQCKSLPVFEKKNAKEVKRLLKIH